jgi:hypothetical protein
MLRVAIVMKYEYFEYITQLRNYLENNLIITHLIIFCLMNSLFFADKAYDVKSIYSTVKDIYHGECIIPLNKQNNKYRKNDPTDTRFVKQDL